MGHSLASIAVLQLYIYIYMSNNQRVTNASSKLTGNPGSVRCHAVPFNWHKPCHRRGWRLGPTSPPYRGRPGRR